MANTALSAAVRAFLSAPRFAVVATVNADGLPQQTVLWYELRGDAIIINTARGRLKDQNLRRDPRVSMCVADAYRFVTITGRAELIDDQEIAQADILGLAVRYDGFEEGTRQAETFRKQERITVKVPIEHVYQYGLGEGK
ncbi:MAG: PPOX class F420-dependent oxidoreductase [Ktedonobacterales bacterium]